MRTSFGAGSIASIAAVLLLAGSGHADQPPSLAAPSPGATKEPRPEEPILEMGVASASIRLSATSGVQWSEGQVAAFVLTGEATISQGTAKVRAKQLVVWFTPGRPAVADVYADEELSVTERDGTESSPKAIYVRFATSGGLVCSVPLAHLEQAPTTPFYMNAFYTRFPEMRPKAKPARRPRREFIPPDLDWKSGWTQIEQRGPIVLVSLAGDVRVTWRGHSIEADAVHLGVRKPAALGGPGARLERIYAEGAVTFSSGPDVLHCEQIFLDATSQTALALNTIMRHYQASLGLHFVFHSPEVRQLSLERYVTQQGGLTTSPFGDPPWRLQGRRVTLSRGRAEYRARHEQREEQEEPLPTPDVRDDVEFAGERVEAAAEAKSARGEDGPEALILTAHHSVFYAGDLPVFYWPYMAKDLGYPRWLVKSIEWGHESYSGTFVETELDLYDLGIYSNRWSELTLDLDYYSLRGVGFGPTFRYETDDRLGLLQTYYIRDTSDEDESGVDTPRKDRGRALWRHREFLSPEWRLDAEFSYLSDFNFLRTYERPEADSGKEQETYVYLRRLKANSVTAAIVKPRINNFQTVVVRRPSIAYHVIGEPLTQYGLVHTHHTDFSNLKLLQDERDGASINDDAKDVQRLDAQHELSRPFRLAFVQVDPFVDAEATGWSEKADNNDESTRFATGYGTRASTNFYRTYEAHNDLLSVNRMRHVITPRVAYRNLWYVSQRPEKYVQHDEVDARDETHLVQTGLRNRWQTKRGNPMNPYRADFLTLDITHNAYVGDKGANADKDDFVETDFTWLMSDELTFKSIGNEYVIRDDRWAVADAQVYYSHFQPLALGYHHEYYDDVGSRPRSISTVSTTYSPMFSRWTYYLGFSYDFNGERNAANADDERSPKQLGMEMRFIRKIHQWVLTVNLDFHKNRDDDTSVSVSLLPEGLAGS